MGQKPSGRIEADFGDIGIMEFFTGFIIAFLTMGWVGTAIRLKRLEHSHSIVVRAILGGNIEYKDNVVQFKKD